MVLILIVNKAKLLQSEQQDIIPHLKLCWINLSKGKLTTEDTEITEAEKGRVIFCFKTSLCPLWLNALLLYFKTVSSLASSQTSTPRSLALASLLPAFSPAITR